MSEHNRPEGTSEQTSIPDGETPGATKGPRATARAAAASVTQELEAFKAQLREEMRAELAQAKQEIHNHAQETIAEERQVMNQRLASVQTQVLAAQSKTLSDLKPADFANMTLRGDDTLQGPDLRRRARPLPEKGFVALELVHGSFVGETVACDRKEGSEAIEPLMRDGAPVIKRFWQREVSKTEVIKTLDGGSIGLGALVGDLDSFKPARPGDVIIFDMTRTGHRKTAQILRDSGCAERL